MADYRAIADVTRTLRTLLLDQVEYEEGSFDVTIAPPDLVPTRERSGPWLNLYLYQVSENITLKNQDIPGQGHPAAYGRPPLSLDLYYLLTAKTDEESGVDGELNAQLLLGAAMRVFHDRALVTEGLSITRDSAGVIGDPVLAARLRGEFEQVKITLEPVTLDDLSKLWTALPQGNFRRSVAYRVSVIQIESRRTRRYPRPVGEPPAGGPRIVAVPSTAPRIRELRIRRNGEERPHPYGGIGQILVVLGSGFSGANTRVHIGSVEVHADVLQDRRIEVHIPDDPALQPGPVTVRVSRQLDMGDPPRPHVGFHSNLAVFMLVPWIVSATLVDRRLSLTGHRLYRPEGDCLLLLGDRVVPASDYIESTEASVSFDLPGDLPAGAYGVRVRVGGVENIELPRVEVLGP